MVLARWSATASSTSGTPVMSRTTTLARWARIPRRSCSVSWRARGGVEQADDGQDEQPLSDLQHGGRQFADRVLLLADDALALLDEADRDGVGDAVRGGLVGVEHLVQQVEVVAVLLEQRSGEDIAEQQDDAHDLVGLHAAGDDPFGEVAGVAPQLVDAARLEHRDVVVVDRRDLVEHLPCGHRREQVRVGDPVHPLLPQPAAVVPQVGDQRGQQLASSPGFSSGAWTGCCPGMSLRSFLVVPPTWASAGGPMTRPVDVQPSADDAGPGSTGRRRSGVAACEAVPVRGRSRHAGRRSRVSSLWSDMRRRPPDAPGGAAGQAAAAPSGPASGHVPGTRPSVARCAEQIDSMVPRGGARGLG